MAYRVSKAEFEGLVERALAELPARFAEFLEEVPVEIMDKPDARQVRQYQFSDPKRIMGLYDGVPLTERSVEHSGVRPPVIYIFRETIERFATSEADLIQQVRTTVLHEIGHHFGMSEDDLDELGYG